MPLIAHRQDLSLLCLYLSYVDSANKSSIIGNNYSLNYTVAQAFVPLKCTKPHLFKSLLTSISPQYSAIGTAIRVPMSTLGLHPLPDYPFQCTLEWWLNNGNWSDNVIEGQNYHIPK